MSSKAAKKNQKRREKKKDEKLTNLVEEKKREEEEFKQEDPCLALKTRLAEAKANGDNKLAAKLRQDLWVLQDASSGVNLKLEQEEVKESIGRINAQNLTPAQSEVKQATTPCEQTSTHSPAEKEIRKLKKKLEQIDKLKKAQLEGGTLEETQLEKISKEEEFKKEIADIEKMMNTFKVVR